MTDHTVIDARLTQFADLLLCCHKLYLWEYDIGFHLLRSNCPHEDTVGNLIGLLHSGRTPEDIVGTMETPMLVTNDMGMLWVMEPRIESEELTRLYVLGPLFLDDVSPKNMEEQLNRHALSNSMRLAAQDFLRDLPVIPLTRVFEYAIMLHYCVYEKKIRVSDLRYDTPLIQAADNTETEREQIDAHGTYKAEREMLRMVREGDIANYRARMDRVSVTGSMGKLASGDSLRQMKNAVITCLVLFSRAAMEGGLDPEVSYSLSDRYFQSIEACSSISALVEISRPMQEDYIRRVHSVRTSSLSRGIKTCCDYIDLHLEDHIDLPALARHSGYAEYYLSRKFKKETGLAPSDYIRQKRLERAALLLAESKESINKIASRLQFSSQSHFCDCFRRQYGMSPGEYRAGTDRVSST